MKPTEATLRDLYETQHLSTRAIAEQFGVYHLAVRRWLQAYGIPARPNGRGMANRGQAVPTAAQLDHWLHTEHMSLRAIAAMLHVDPAAVRLWAIKAGVRCPTVWESRYKGMRPVLPDEAALRALYDAGESLTSIGARSGVSAMVITRLCHEYGIVPRESGWGQTRLSCADGHRVRSTYELRVDDWLTARGIAHTYEPVCPFDRRSHADYLANGWYIEIWGVDAPVYNARKARKIAQYRAHNLPLIELAEHHFNPARKRLWARRLSAVLTVPTFFGLFPGIDA